jgi:hypothetical protein
MTTYLPFNIYKKPETETCTIADENGNKLEVPKYGWITWQENYEFSQYTLKVGDDEAMSVAAYETEIVVMFLRLRFNIPSEIPKEQILVYPDGKPFSQSMIDGLSKFFKNERTRWEQEKQDKSNKPKQDPK